MVNFKKFISNSRAAIQFDSVEHYVQFCEIFCADKTIQSSNYDRMKTYANDDELCVNFNQGYYHSFARKSYYLADSYSVVHYSKITDFQIVYELWT